MARFNNLGGGTIVHSEERVTMPYLNITFHPTKLHVVLSAKPPIEIKVSPSAEGELDRTLTELRENPRRVPALTGNVHPVM